MVFDNLLERFYGLFSENRLSFGLAVVIAIWLVGGLFYHFVEKFSTVDSFYFAATTLTTVGFGDLHPHTTIGKAFTVIYVFVGLGIVLYVLSLFGRHYVDSRFESLEKRQRERRRRVSR